MIRRTITPFRNGGSFRELILQPDNQIQQFVTPSLDSKFVSYDQFQTPS
jgi:hypothetical protein